MESCESRSLLSATTAAIAVGDVVETPAVSEDAVNLDGSVELAVIDPLIAECWEVKPVWLDPNGIEGVEDGLGCGVAEDFVFVADDSVVTDAVTDGDVVELEGEVSVYELEDFDPSWVIRGCGTVFEETASPDEGFVKYAFDPLPLDDVELSDPIWCDFTGLEGVEDGLGCGVAEDFVLDDVVSDEPVVDDSFVMYGFDPVAIGDSELIDPIWCDFGGLDGLGCGVAVEGFVDGEIVVEETPDKLLEGDSEVSVYELEGFDPSWAFRGGVVADETVPLDDSFVMYPFDPVAPGDLEFLEPIWCDFGGMEGWEDGLGCGVSIDGYVPPGELIDGEIVDVPVDGEEQVVEVLGTDDFENVPIRWSVSGGGEIEADGGGGMVFNAFDPLPSDDAEIPELVVCDFGVILGWEDGLGCGVSIDGYVPPGETGEVVENFEGEAPSDGDELVFITGELPVEDQNVIDLVWEDFSGTGGWAGGVSEEIPVEIYAPVENFSDSGPDVIFESLDWLAYTTVLTADAPAEDAEALVYQSLPVEDLIISSDDSTVIAVSADVDAELPEVLAENSTESAEEVSEEAASGDLGNGDASELTYAATELEEDLFESLSVL
jgi:hypothetical protein